MKPELMDFVYFVLLTAAFFAACRFMMYRKEKSKKPSPASVLLPLIESRPLPCKICPVHGACEEMHNQ